MAKDKNEKKLETVLWSACDKLRGAVEPAEYKHVILSLIFLKYANDRFDIQREKLIKENKPEFMLDTVSFYEQDNVFFVPECARWNYLMSQAKQEGLAIKIDTALHEIEMKNPSLSGALPDNYYSRLELENSDLASLLDKMNQNDEFINQDEIKPQITNSEEGKNDNTVNDDATNNNEYDETIQMQSKENNEDNENNNHIEDLIRKLHADN